jgi:hypothetical protein
VHSEESEPGGQADTETGLPPQCAPRLQRMGGQRREGETPQPSSSPSPNAPLLLTFKFFLSIALLLCRISPLPSQAIHSSSILGLLFCRWLALSSFSLPHCSRATLTTRISLPRSPASLRSPSPTPCPCFAVRSTYLYTASNQSLLVAPMTLVCLDEVVCLKWTRWQATETVTSHTIFLFA